MFRSFAFFLLIASATAQTKRVGKYEITLRPPSDGLFAGEEMQIEFRVADTSKPDPLMGATPVIRAEVRSVVDMPSMPGMSKINEIAHPEGVPGDYGLHPTFAHGGEYRMRMTITPPGAPPFDVEYLLDVKDADPKRAAKAAAFKPFRLEFLTNPKRIRTGEPAELRLRIFANPNPANPNAAKIDPRKALTEFDINHEKKLHLIVVHAKDFLPFAHLHPELEADGTFVVRHTFTTPGEYSVFADSAPKGAGAQVLYAKTSVTGKALAPAETATPLRVELSSSTLEARKTTTLNVTVRDPQSGAPLTNLEPYLGAMGHLILIADDGVTFVHSHPDERVHDAGQTGTIPFLVRPPRPGRYRGMVEVQRQGRVERNSFEVEAK